MQSTSSSSCTLCTLTDSPHSTNSSLTELGKDFVPFMDLSTGSDVSFGFDIDQLLAEPSPSPTPSSTLQTQKIAPIAPEWTTFPTAKQSQEQSLVNSKSSNSLTGDSFSLFDAPANTFGKAIDFNPKSSLFDGVWGSTGTPSGSLTLEQEISNDMKAESLASWVESVIAGQGGVITSANLGSTLSSTNPGLYRVIKQQYGGLCALLSRFPHQFVLADNPPYNHVMISPSHKSSSIHMKAKQQAKRSKQTKKSSRSSPNLMSHVDMSVLERDIVSQTQAILLEASHYSLKAVELANTLRARLGADVLATVRERCGGLLTVLEQHPSIFQVRRIPKSDCVCLVNPQASITAQQQQGGMKSSISTNSIVSCGSAASEASLEDMAFSAMQETDPTLSTLTSEYCVPTQVWIPDQYNDWKYVNLIINELSVLGGAATVPKLRGLMKDALGCPRSIKSVPLKAFIAAYHQHFQMVGNRVTLVPPQGPYTGLLF